MYKTTEVLELAVQIEKNGEKIYRNAIRHSRSQDTRRMLEKLADEEVQHAELFSKMKARANAETDDPLLDEMGKSILIEILGSQTFSLQSADVAGAYDIKGLLRSAVEFEKDTIIFYEMLLSLVKDDETAECLKGIIAEEKQHIQYFQGALARGEF